MLSMSAAATLGVTAAPRRRIRAATSSSESGNVSPLGSSLARQLRGDGGLRAVSSRGVHRNGRKISLSPRAFSPATGDFSVTLPEGAAALTIVLGARVALIGWDEERDGDELA